MSNPGEFIQACAAGKVWVFCKNCDAPRNFNDVEHIRTVENPSYWGADPWWYEMRVFRCPDCGTEQQSPLHRES
ncbi:MAG: hypothetical protein C0617_06540 [Desulfuromonas sp.]|uniref:hypothetical protein n=1 Tax=Desulfuromonas sp. TaxID=892 RepID=UPI000CB62073|nr:hypothetical protein [Desulfuromonas sp.]PLX84862.1 MAG: hypothetical protein C0617_06540 [Desulfuromonas sp.]